LRRRGGRATVRRQEQVMPFHHSATRGSTSRPGGRLCRYARSEGLARPRLAALPARARAGVPRRSGSSSISMFWIMASVSRDDVHEVPEDSRSSIAAGADCSTGGERTQRAARRAGPRGAGTLVIEIPFHAVRSAHPDPSRPGSAHSSRAGGAASARSRGRASWAWLITSIPPAASATVRATPRRSLPATPPR